MLQIDPRFEVTFPEGSTSLKLEHAIIPSTEELNGSALQINLETYRRNKDLLDTEVQTLVSKCRDITGDQEFQPNSSKDCKREFLEKRKLPVQRKTDKGEPSLDKETLIVFKDMGDDLAGAVVDAREAISKQSQMKAWAVYAEAGSVQATWNQLGTPHGRYSCDSPNLQNRILEIRETVQAPEGWKFLSLDMGQAEYVTWASLSGCATLSHIFAAGDDLHQEMGEDILQEVPTLDLRGETPRSFGKTINFALLYLMKPYALAGRLGCGVDMATHLINIYASKAPGAVAYRNEKLEQYRRDSTPRTKFGRGRHCPVTANSHERDKTMWHHHNAGTAAEALKIKQARCHNALKAANYQADRVRLVIQFHDELIYQVREEVLDEVKPLVLEHFNRPIPGLLSFKTDLRTGSNWLEISK